MRPSRTWRHSPVSRPVRRWRGSCCRRCASAIPGCGATASRPPTRPTDRLAAALADWSLLLLDNCEHVVTGAAQFVGRLLATRRSVRVLATSREPLGITGEALCPLSGLPVPPPDASPAEVPEYPSVRLFLDRAADAAASGGKASGGEAPVPTVPGGDPDPVVVGQICRTLDGLPLAIELAAARLRTLSAEEIAERLEDRFALLSRGSRTAPPRHRTLRAVVEWSWDPLSPPERVLARRLTAFAGGATLAALERVAAAPAGMVAVPAGQLVDLLSSLVERSLVEVTDGRYRMLETVRAYGAEQLASAGETEQLRHTHAAYFLDLAREADSHLRRSEQLVWLARLDRERDNLHAALRRATAAGDNSTAFRLVAALSMYWWLRGSRAEAAALASELLAATGPAPAEAQEAQEAAEALPEEYALCVLIACLGSPHGPATPPDVWSAEAVARRLGRPLRQPFLHFLSAVATGPPRRHGADMEELLERSSHARHGPVEPGVVPVRQRVGGPVGRRPPAGRGGSHHRARAGARDR